MSELATLIATLVQGGSCASISITRRSADGVVALLADLGQMPFTIVHEAKPCSVEEPDGSVIAWVQGAVYFRALNNMQVIVSTPHERITKAA